jgi:hypothetical protein
VSQFPAALRVTTALLAGAVLCGCAGSASETPPAASTSASSPAAAASPAVTPTPVVTATWAPTITDVKAALADPSHKKPQSASIKLVSKVEGTTLLVMTGRLNLVGSLTGHATYRVKAVGKQKAQSVQEVITRRTLYLRSSPGSSGRVTGPWRQGPATKAATSVPKLQEYATLLAKQGPAAMKGQKWIDGVPSTLLSGRIAAGQIKKIDPTVYDQMRSQGVDDFACDLWVDRKGRVIRLEQWLTVKNATAHNIVTLTAYRGPITVRPPV